MRVQTIGSRLVHPDGTGLVPVQAWADGSVHEVTPEHGASLIAAGWARRHDGPMEQPAIAVRETKDVGEPAEDDEKPKGRKSKG